MGKQLFKNIPSKVGDLVNDVRIGRIGLPDLQRPFVWMDNKVRDLFDSMLKGYPIGYVMLWESPTGYESKKSNIGINDKIYDEPKELVIDGQQRLTALIAAMYGVTVKDKNFKERDIKISFNPLTKEFAVWSSAYEKDSEWISKISDVFLAKENNSIVSFRKKFIKELNEGRNKKGLDEVSDDEEITIEESINELEKTVSPVSLFGLNTNMKQNESGDLKVKIAGGFTYCNVDDVRAGIDIIDKYKVYISAASYDHAGQPDKNGQRKVLSIVDVLPPKTISTSTYIVIKSFDNEEFAKNLVSYLKTRFVRFLLAQICISQHISRDTFGFVPEQDFSKPWTDEELYAKYELTQEEIDFIESMIKPMDLGGDDNG